MSISLFIILNCFDYIKGRYSKLFSCVVIGTHLIFQDWKMIDISRKQIQNSEIKNLNFEIIIVNVTSDNIVIYVLCLILSVVDYIYNLLLIVIGT